MIKVLFVCLGNICRSPLAEAILKHLIKQDEILKNKIYIDSAGTNVISKNAPPDYRIIKIAIENNIIIKDQLSRQFVKEDLEYFDYILVMDEFNYESVKSLDIQNQYENKIKYLSDFRSNEKDKKKIIDPFYMEDEFFKDTFTRIEDCCQNFLKHLCLKYEFKV